jgi:hypothetical protein
MGNLSVQSARSSSPDPFEQGHIQGRLRRLRSQGNVMAPGYHPVHYFARLYQFLGSFSIHPSCQVSKSQTTLTILSLDEALRPTCPSLAPPAGGGKSTRQREEGCPTTCRWSFILLTNKDPRHRGRGSLAADRWRQRCDDRDEVSRSTYLWSPKRKGTITTAWKRFSSRQRPWSLDQEKTSHLSNPKTVHQANVLRSRLCYTLGGD